MQFPNHNWYKQPESERIQESKGSNTKKVCDNCTHITVNNPDSSQGFCGIKVILPASILTVNNSQLVSRLYCGSDCTFFELKQ